MHQLRSRDQTRGRGSGSQVAVGPGSVPAYLLPPPGKVKAGMQTLFIVDSNLIFFLFKEKYEHKDNQTVL